MAQLLRREVLGVYKRILRLSKNWVAKDQSQTESERHYIWSEAKLQFRKNKNLANIDEISLCVKEAEARYSIGIHYKIPYPRPVNLPPHAFAKKTAQQWQKNK